MIPLRERIAGLVRRYNGLRLDDHVLVAFEVAHFELQSQLNDLRQRVAALESAASKPQADE